MHLLQHIFFDGMVLGCLATVIFDLWLCVQKRMGLPILNFAYLGRWIGHFRHLKCRHANIARAPAIPYEWVIGLIGHYLIGMGIAGGLLLTHHDGWLGHPDLAAALQVGLATVVLPLCIMQPAMGGGFAFAQTAHPVKNSLKSLLNHAVFGVCLYVAACVMLRMPVNL